MWRLPYLMQDVVPVALIAALVLLLIKKRLGGLRRCLADWLFVCYLLAMFSLTGIPSVKDLTFDPSFNFLPQEIDLKGAALNALLFVPLGLFLPLLWTEFRDAKKAVLAGFTLSLTIEILQIFTFRLSDVNDLLTNTLGTLLGYLAAKLLMALGVGARGKRALPELPALLGLSFGLLFLVQPYISAALWAIMSK